jgi:Leucine-rich repeat (LRR) protein
MRIKAYIDPTGKLVTWKNSTNKEYCKSFWGVTCGVDGKDNTTVTSIKIRYVGVEQVLLGRLPPAAVFQGLPGLQELHIEYQNISGTLPGEWGYSGYLKQLKSLNLRGNKLITGTLPEDYKALTALQFLDLGRNNLTGALPAPWGRLTQLKELSLYRNKLTGPLPVAYRNLTALENVYLGDNQFTGNLPAAWSQLKQLQELEVTSNNLTGPLPPSWGQLKQLQFLMLANNSLTGSVPSRWTGMMRPRGLSLYIDLTNNTNLGGCLPSRWRSGKVAVDFELTGITGYC